MKTRTVVFLVLAFVIGGCADKDAPPKAEIKVVSDTYFGVEVDDPYRYMENMDDTIFLNWMKVYADYSKKQISEIPGRQGLITLMEDFDKRKSDKIYWLTIAENGRYFYQKIRPEDETGKLYYRNSYDDEEKLLYDPETFSETEGVSYVISSISPDLKGNKVGITVAPNGSESSTLLIIDVESGTVLPDRVAQVFGGVSWLKDGNAFLYGKTNSDDVHDPLRFINTKVYYHQLGNKQSADKVIFSSKMNPEVAARPEEIPFVFYNNDNNDLYLALYTVERYLKLFHAPAGNFDPEIKLDWRPLFKKDDQVQNFEVIDDDLYMYTAKDAPQFQVLKTSLSKPDLENAEVVVPQSDLGMISSFSFSSDGLFYTIKINGVEERLFMIPKGETEAKELELPAKAGALSVRTRGYKFSDIWVGISGWTMDGKRYRYNADENSFTPEPLSSQAEFPEYADLIVEELMVPSHDGVMVPLSLVYKKGIALDGTAPLIMTGYGAYGIPQTPGFSPNRLIWTLKGGIFASAHVRGGGELGDAWRLAGQKTTKPNTWKDLIACGEFLVSNNYTSEKHMAIFGGSAGGILIGRAMTERPDLWAAAIPLVGVMNPLRAEESPNGPVNAPEFGTVKDSVECMALMEMDSYLKIEDGVNYPATMITAGFNDPRVIVWQPAKFAARLQAANASKNPILFDVDYSSGHGIGDTKSKGFEDLADIFGFALWQTGHPEFQK